MDMRITSSTRPAGTLMVIMAIAIINLQLFGRTVAETETPQLWFITPQAWQEPLPQPFLRLPQMSTCCAVIT